jgi:hypothetical protein
MASNKNVNLPQTAATRRTWMKTVAVVAGAAAAESLAPTNVEAQTGRATAAADNRVV